MGLREGVRAVAAHPHRRDHPGLRHLDAGRPQRRVAGQRRRGQGVEGKLHRVQAEGGEVRQEISGGTHVRGRDDDDAAATSSRVLRYHECLFLRLKIIDF